MVAYLKKPEGSEDFHQIVDFLNTSHIRYALTENLTIYVSLIQQFWETASTRTLDNGEVEITTTIDEKVKIVTEASIRRHLKLEDSDGITSLPTTEIFEQLSLMGSKKTSWEQFSSNIATSVVTIRQFEIMGVSTASTDFTTANVPVTTAGAEISTASPKVKTASDFVDDIAAESLVYIKRSAAKTKDKGKGIMEESESAMTKTKRQQEQERLGYEAVVRLQVKLEEEERQRIARVHKSASSFNVEEWEDIKARVEADEELA
ncbi:hypothetical protein Tco_0598461 [Tanacetum coccineum]